MGLFDKWKPKMTPMFTRTDAEELKNTVNNGLQQIDKTVQPGTTENNVAKLEAQGFDLDQASAATPLANPPVTATATPPQGVQNADKLPNNGLLQTKWDIPDLSKDKNIQRTLDMNAEGADFLSGMAPMSEEEQNERARRAEAIMGIGHLGNSLAALANVFAVGRGATSQNLQPLQGPDVQAWLDKGRQQRLQYNQMVQNQKMQNQELQMKKDAADRKAEYDKAMQPLQLALQQKKIDAETYKALAEKYGASKAEAEAEVKQIEAQYKPQILQSTVDRNNASAASSQASAAASMATANLRRTEEALKANSNNIPLYSDAEGTINISKEKLMNNLGQLHGLTGESATKESPSGLGTVSKTSAELIMDISKHMNDEDGKLRTAIKNVQRGKKKKAAQGGGGHAGGNSSSSTQAGDTGVWGKSIHRPK